ncbi:hypothetical protein INT45_003989 [Circinella minor]|uniref:TIGR02453 family protein n=1 Tax=Circinella minor TaxID=1195481 RepID=A0A8H7RWD8_9FUNG|nr:hypothetical protein INT45_003989 [Circinella minor]
MATQQKKGDSKKKKDKVVSTKTDQDKSTNTIKKRKSPRQLATTTKKQKKATHERSSDEEEEEEEEEIITSPIKNKSVSTRKSTRATTRGTKNTKKEKQPEPQTSSEEEEEEEEEEDNDTNYSEDDNDNQSSEDSSVQKEESSSDDFQSPPPRLRSGQIKSRKKKTTPATTTTTTKKKKKLTDTEDEDEEVDKESNNTTTVTIPRPKGSPFPDALNPDQLQFIAELIADNSREFMHLNQKRWHTVRRDFMDFVKMLSEQLHEVDPTILIEEPRYAVYRQARDLRFSKDLIPYKSYMKASFSRGGKRSPLPGYTIVVRPNNETCVMAGVYDLSSQDLGSIRHNIIQNGDLLREALTLPIIKETFGRDGIAALDDKDKLKVAPKNIARDHPEIELLRFKSFIVSKTFSDLDVVSSGFLDKVLDVYEALVPFVAILNAWVTN